MATKVAPQLISTVEAAHRVGVTLSCFHQQRRKRALKTLIVGHRTFVQASDVELVRQDHALWVRKIIGTGGAPT